jgi:hypothetical protein
VKKNAPTEKGFPQFPVDHFGLKRFFRKGQRCLPLELDVTAPPIGVSGMAFPVFALILWNLGIRLSSGPIFLRPESFQKTGTALGAIKV